MRRSSRANLFSQYRRPLAATVIYGLLFQIVLPAAPLTQPVALPIRPLYAAQAATAAMQQGVAVASDATVVLHDVVTGATDIAALEHEPSSNHLLAAAETGQTALATIDSDGAPHPFSSLAAIDEPVVATSRATGDVFVAASGSSVIARVKSGGTAVANPWATLANAAIADLHVDNTGAWGGDVVAVTTTGAVWRIGADAQAKLVATIGVSPAGVTTIPIDEGRYGPWSGAIVVGARASATLHAIDAAGVVKAFTIGVTPRDVTVAAAHENFYGIDRADGTIRGARGDAFARMAGDLVVAQHSPGVLARVRWDGSEFVTTKIAEGGKWDRVVFSPAGVGAIPPARRIYDAVAVVRHAPVLTGGRVEGALWQLTAENLTLDGTDVITSDLLVPGTPKVVVGSGKPSFNGVIQGSDGAEPSGYTITIQGNAALRHVINRTDPMTLASVIPPPAPAGTRDVALSATGETIGDFATLRNLSLSGKAGEVTVPAGTYGRFSATGRTVMIFGTAGATSASIYNLERLDLAGGAELRVAGPTVIHLRDGATVTGASAGAINAPGQLILNVAGGDVQVLGTAVLAALVRVPSGAVTIDGTGLLRGTVGADRLSVSGSGVLQVTQNDVPPPQVNRPPTVSAGADQTINLPDDTLRLEGVVSDDGLPRGSSLAVSWSVVEGAGVSFSDPSAAITRARFAAPGTYVLRLAANDSALRTTDDVIVTVLPENKPPQAAAGADQRVELPAKAALSGTATDDGLPAGSSLSVTWSRASGPGPVTFEDATKLATRAAFSVAGVYTLRLTVTDGDETVSDDLTVTVDPENQAPLVAAGDDQIIVLPAGATLRGSASDDGWPHGSTLTTKWTKLSGAGEVTFGDATQLETAAAFASAGAYVLRLSATDGRATSFDDVSITVDPVNAAPTVDAGADTTIELPNAATLSGVVDDDGWPRGSTLAITWSTVSGPAAVAFANARAAATAATFTKTGDYTLRLTATDGEATASDDVSITVYPQNQPPTVDAGADATIRLPATATLSGKASDDGWPFGSSLTTTWSKVSGPGSVTFASAASLSTAVTFSTAGTYVLRLSATDTRATTADDLTITVLPANQAPLVSAGADATAAAGANLVRNGGAETARADGSLEAWSVVSGSFTRLDSGAVEGDAYVRAAGAGELTQSVDVSPLPQGTAVEVSAWVRGAARVAFDFRSASGALLDSFEAIAQPSAGWSAVTETRAAPAGTTTIRVRLIASGEAAFDAIVVRAPGVATAALLGTVADDGLPAGNMLATSWSTVSGPAAVVFVDATDANTTAAFSKPGTYVLRLTATDGEMSASDEVSIVVSSANQPPVVDAGGAQSVRLPATATLSARATDDNLPTGSVLTISWSAVSGADSVTIAGASTLTPTLTFATAGTYVLRLTVTDSEFTIHDDVTIAVAAANHPPVVSAGADATITLPESATLAGSASDEDGTAVTLQWTVVSGGPVTFANATSATTTATFSAAGTYVLRVTASDGELSASDDVTITVRPEPVNQAPLVDAGEPQSGGVGEQVQLRGTASDDGLPAGSTLAVTWSAVNGPGQVTFANANAAETSATFSAAGTYTLRLSATDSLLAAADETTVTVLDTPVAAFTVPGVSRFAAHWNNNVASLNEGASIAAVSSFGSSFAAEKALDDDYDSRWASATGQATNQFIIVDLAGSDAHVIDRVRIVNASGSESVRNFRIDVSATTADASAFTAVASGTLTDSDRVQELIFAPVEARYVRLFVMNSRSSSTVSIRSFEVIAPKLSGIASYLTPPSVGSFYEGTTVIAAGAGHYAIDRDVATTWSPGKSNAVGEIVFAQTYTIDRVRLVNSGDTTGRSVKNFKVEVSIGSTVPTVYTTVLEATAADTVAPQDFVFPAGAVDARVVRVTLSTNYGNAYVTEVRELEFFTAPGPAASVSSYQTRYRPELLLDGASNTTWTTAHGRVAGEFVTLYLGDSEPQLIDGVALAAGTTFGVAAFDVLVSETTDAADAFRPAVSGTLVNDSKLYEFPFASGPMRARYVKLVVKSNFGGGHASVGTFLPRTIDSAGNLVSAPVPPPPTRHLSPAHVVNGATVTASSGTPSLMLDYVHSSTWSTANKTAQWAKIDLAGEQAHFISGVIVGARLGSASMPAEAPKDFEIWVSSTTSDDAAFTKLYSGTVTVNGLNRFEFPTTAAKFIKYVPLTSHGTSTSIGTGYFDVISPAGGVVAWSSSRDANVGPLAFDGTRSTYWLTSGTSNEWLTVALPGTATHKVYGIYIDAYGGEGPKDFEIRVSNTTSEASAFTTAYSGTVTDPSQRYHYFGRTFDAKYVQFFWKTTTGSWTIGVFDLSVLTVTNSGAAVLGVSGTASNSVPIESLIDANPRNQTWTLPANRTTNEFVTVALPGDALYIVDHVALQGPPSCCGDRLPRDFEIQVSTEDAREGTFRTVFRGTMRSHPALMQHFFFPPTPARHVRLMIRNNWGSSTMWLQNFLIFSPQVGSMTARFIDTSSQPEAIVSWDWDFGDGGRSSERDPVHQYAAPGVYDVRLTVRNADSHSSTYTLRYRAIGPPVADFTFSPNPSNEGSNVTFVDASTSNLGALTNHRWSWGDNTADDLDGATTAHAFDDNGTYAVTHTVSNARGVSASVTKEVTVRNVPPRANAGRDVAGLWGDDWGATHTSNDVSAADRASLLCKWDFGDGQTVEQPNCYGKTPRHAYQAPGTYTATLTVIDKDGGSHSDSLIATMGMRKSVIRYTGSSEITPDQPVKIEAILRDLGNGLPIANRQVVFTMEGQSATAVTDAGGYARTTLPYLGLEENPTVTATFGGDVFYEKSSVAAVANCALNPDVLDIALLFDVSGSMGAPIAEAKTAARNFLSQIKPQDAVSIISFADDVRIDSPLGLDRTLTNKAIDQLSIRGGTLIHVGLDGSRLELLGTRHRANARPILILLSDGEAPEAAAIAAADQAKAAGIRIVSIVVNNITAGMELMKKLASPGDYYVSSKAEELNSIYASIVGTFCTPTNKPPTVIAPFDQTLIVPQYSVALDATVRDDGLPAYSTLTTTWSKVSGPGNVTFANASSPDTTVTFDAIGTYVLRLSATDTEYTRTDDVTISIRENTPPVVSAGADRTVGLPPGTVSLSGTVIDETVPAGATLTTTWSVTSGAGTVTFADASSLTTTATFSAVGAYTLKLTANDSLVTASDEVVLTVLENDAPVVTAGADQRIAIGANLLINGGNDDPLAAGSIRGWSPVSGTWSRPDTGVNGLPAALRGTTYFYAGNDVSAELRQDVDVSALASRIDAGQQQFAWSAFARNAAEAITDTANVVVEYRNADNTAVLTGHGVEISGAQWTKGEATDTAPAGTRWVRVRITATRRSGATTDVFIDAVTLRAVGAAQTTLAGSAMDDGVPQPLETAWSVVSGAGALTFGDSASATSTAVANTAGDYTLRFTANDGSSAVTDDMLLTVSAANQAPSVEAGPDAEVRLPSTATLTALVADDSGPSPTTVRWELLTGPEAVTLSDANSVSTTATFTKGGQYRFRVFTDDSDEITFDTVTINVLSSSGNAAPSVEAGADILISAPNTSATLHATVTDDGLPTGSTLATTWSQASGPGTATFSDAASRTPTVTFDRHGIYILRLTATDSELTTTDDVTVRYDGTNQAPSVNAGADQSVKVNAPATLDATVTDDNLPLGATLSLTWTKVSGPGTVTFSANTSATTEATFSETGTYVLRITASDSALSVTDDVAITVEPALLPPTVEITSPESGSIVTAPTVVTGVVSEGAKWRLDYRLNANDAAAAGNRWATLATGVGPVNGRLGTFDPTLLLNGTYKVRLVATGPDGQSEAVSISVSVEGELKVGVFSLTFLDTRLPLPGIRVDVVRSYDSRDKRAGDFGYGWMLATRNVRIEKSGVLGSGWFQDRSGVSPMVRYCLTSAVPRYVSVTFPTGQVYRFNVVAEPSCQSLAPIETPTMKFVPAAGTHAQLEAVGENDVIVNGSIPGPVELITADLRPYDPTLFRLTLPSGVVYVIDEQSGIRSVTDANANQITLGRDGMTHSAGRSISFARDAAGRIVRITDAAGGAISYTYDSAGNLIATTDQEGRTTKYVYDGQHNILSIEDPRGVVTLRNEYDAAGRLVRQVGVGNGATTYGHEVDSLREVVRDEFGNVTTIEYDERGNVLKTTDPLGNVFKRTYDERNNLLTDTDATGNTTNYAYDVRNNVTRVVDPLGGVSEYTYDSADRMLTHKDPRGAVVTQAYDAKGNLASITDAAGHVQRFTYLRNGLLNSFTDPSGAITLYGYDSNGNRQKVVNPNGETITFTFDDAGRQLTQTVVRTLPDGAQQPLTTTFAYDKVGRLTKKIDPDGSTTQTVYNAAGNVASSIDAAGRETKYDYHDDGTVKTIRYPDGTTETTAVDAAGRITAKTDRGGQTTTFVYDALGRQTETRTPDGLSRKSVYDANGRAAAVIDPRGSTIRYEYDGAGRTTRVIGASGTATTYAYDLGGKAVAVTSPGGNVTSSVYDANGRVTEIIHPDGTRRKTAYDSNGRVVAHIDEEGRETRLLYDGMGQMTGVVDPLGQTTTYTYDERGNLTAQTDAMGRATRFEYDANGRRTRRILPGGAAETYSYSAVGQTLTKTDFNGRTTTYAYDAVGRLTSRTPDPAFGESPVTFTYDALGRRTTMTDATGTTKYDYDIAGRLQRKVTPQGTLSYTYDTAGNLLTLTSSNGGGVSVSYTYDAANQLTTVTDAHASATTTYGYTADGTVSTMTLPNGVVASFTRDSRNRVTDAALTRGAERLAAWSYTLDATGARQAVRDQRGATATYTTDLLQRLTRESVTGHPAVNGSLAYVYDSVGNRLSRTSDIAALPAQAFAYDADDRVASDTYDANGNLTATEGVRYRYDSENRLVDVNEGAVRFVYDGDGTRVAKVLNGVETRYLVDTLNPTGRAQVVEEIVGGAVHRVYTYGLSLIAQRQERDGGWTSSYYAHDAHGSVRALLDGSGFVTDSYDYDAFGNLIHRTGQTPNAYLYGSERFDSETGLYHLRARYMQPNTGRFVTADRFEGSRTLPVSLHKYLYAANDPVNRNDPSGYFFSVAEAQTAISIRNTLATAQSDFLFKVMDNFLYGNEATVVSVFFQDAFLPVGMGAMSSLLRRTPLPKFPARAPGERASTYVRRTYGPLTPLEAAMDDMSKWFHTRRIEDMIKATGEGGYVFRYLTEPALSKVLRTGTVGGYATTKFSGSVSEIMRGSQIAEDWGNGCCGPVTHGVAIPVSKLRGWNTPRPMGNDPGYKGFESVTSAYPEHGPGGFPQFILESIPIEDVYIWKIPAP